MKLYTLLFILLISSSLFAQYDSCGIQKSQYSDLYAVIPQDISCIARHSDKDISLFYTFASWCIPCRAHFPAIIDIVKKYDLDFYIVIPERENDSIMVKQTTNYLNKLLGKDYKGLIVSDSLYSLKNRYKKQKKFVLIKTYGVKEREKYANFITQITPPQFENIDDMGKVILVNKMGEVFLITTYKDAEGDKTNEKTFVKIRKYIETERNKE
ncbi:MAG: hypothetical protein QM751_04300 [Paludibacteraceae bacterium]